MSIHNGSADDDSLKNIGSDGPDLCGVRLIGEIEGYEAWLYLTIPPRGDPDLKPDQYLFTQTRNEMLEKLDNLPPGLAAKVVVKARIDRKLYPVDQYGNAIDPHDSSLLANAL